MDAEMEKRDQSIKSIGENNEGDGEMEPSPSYHARRPMNAFLIFCKRHRKVVKDKYPNFENRQVTKILGEWWANLEKEDKACYTRLAKEYKDAFLLAHPHFKWYKLPAPPKRSAATPRPAATATSCPEEASPGSPDTKIKQNNNNNIVKINYNNVQASTSKSLSTFTPGKLADESQMGGLSSLIASKPTELTGGDRSEYSISSTIERLSSQLHNPTNYLLGEDSQKNNSEASSKELNLQRLQHELSEASRILQVQLDNSNRESGVESAADGDENVHSQTDANRVECDSKDAGKKRPDSLSLARKNSESLVDYDDVYDMKNSHYWGHDVQSNDKHSSRTCKGKRYREFMAHGGLVAKRQRRDTDAKSNLSSPDSKQPGEFVGNWAYKEEHAKENASKLLYFGKGDLSKSACNDSHSGSSSTVDSNDAGSHCTFASDDSKSPENFDFDLDAKIEALPALSLERFLQRKRENKKRRKIVSTNRKGEKSQPVSSAKASVVASEVNGERSLDLNNVPMPKKSPEEHVEDALKLAQEHKTAVFIGSQKRKPRKMSITRLDVNSTTRSWTNFAAVETKNEIAYTQPSKVSNHHNHHREELCALNTLAEVAAKMA